VLGSKRGLPFSLATVASFGFKGTPYDRAAHWLCTRALMHGPAIGEYQTALYKEQGGIGINVDQSTVA
jgi:hypothetical protein